MKDILCLMIKLPNLRIMGLILLTAMHLQASAQEPTFSGLFQNRFFTLSHDSELLCTTSESGYLTIERLNEIIHHYENDNPGLRQAAVAFLTQHTHPDHLDDLKQIKKNCRNQSQYELCILEGYWDDKENALRVLALFYDTKTAIKHSNHYRLPRFEADHLYAFEKGLRKIPPFMRDLIVKAKPIRDLDNVFVNANIPEKTRRLILDAFPDDTESQVWADNTHPLTIIPGVGFINQVVAQVYSGTNRIVFTIKNFDKAKEGQFYKDIGLKYLVDFRIPLIVHELAHVIDNFHFWDGHESLYFFFWYRKLSTDIVYMHMIKDADLALWPSRWFDAFEFLWEVNDGRYNGKINEKLAELISQYILIPQRLKSESPEAYAWLQKEIFKGIEYSGYEYCQNPIVRELNWWEAAVARPLGRRWR